MPRPEGQRPPTGMTKFAELSCGSPVAPRHAGSRHGNGRDAADKILASLG